MSYSRSYRTDIKLRGTVKASFPASENGGTQTIEWQHIEPINIYVDVDTNPFDFSVTQCDERIDMLKAAVLSMNTAQVLSQFPHRQSGSQAKCISPLLPSRQ